MVIYGEYLFIENFIVGALLIALTGKLIGQMPGIKRLLAGAALCGVAGFMIFLPLKGAVSVAVRLTLAVVTVLAAFGARKLLKRVAIFWVLSFLSGGALMALLMWQETPAITHRGVIYVDAVTYLRITCFGVLAFGLTYWFVKLIRTRSAHLAAKGKVTVIIDEQCYDFEGFVDSGNSLREPVSGSPVVLIDKSAAAKITPGIGGKTRRLIPYRGVGVDAGFLEGICCDMITFEDKERSGAWLAFYEGYFEDFEILVNKDFLEGGLS